MFSADVPSGKSTNNFNVVELRDCCKLLIKQVQSRESLEAVVVFYFFLFQEKLELVLH